MSADGDTLRAALEPWHMVEREALARLEAAEREVGLQMEAKLEAQMTLKLVTESLDLTFDQLGNGWQEATPKILARIETIVDEAARIAAQRDALAEALRTICDIGETRDVEVARAALAEARLE